MRPISGTRQNHAAAKCRIPQLVLLYAVPILWPCDCTAIARAECDDLRCESGSDLVREPNVLRDAGHLSLSNRGPLSAAAGSDAAPEFLRAAAPVSRNRQCRGGWATCFGRG